MAARAGTTNRTTPRKKLVLRKEALKDLSPAGRQVRGGGSLSGAAGPKYDRRTMPVGVSVSNASTG